MANFTEMVDNFNGTYNQTSTPFTLTPVDFNTTSNFTFSPLIDFNTTSNVTLSHIDVNGTLPSIVDDQPNTGYYHPFRWLESLVGLSGNVLVIIAVSRYEALQNPTCYLLANLAVAGLISASLTMVSVLTESMKELPRWIYFCIFQEVLYVVAYYVTILTLYMISIDRLICLTSRFKYAKYLTLKRTINCVIIMWMGIGAIFGLLFTLRSTASMDMPICIYTLLLSPEDLHLSIAYPYAFFMGLTIINYIVLGFMMYHQGKKAPVQLSLAVNHIQKRHRELTITMTILFAVYSVLSLHMVVITLQVHREVDSFSVHLHYIGLLVWYLNGCINPILYKCLMPKFNSAFRHILRIHSSSVAPVIIQMLNEEHYIDLALAEVDVTMRHEMSCLESLPRPLTLPMAL